MVVRTGNNVYRIAAGSVARPTVNIAAAQFVLEEKGNLASREDLLALSKALFHSTVESWAEGGNYLANAVVTITEWATSVVGDMPVDSLRGHVMEPKIIINPDFDWFQQNYQQLKSKYNNRWIAISNQQIVSDGDSLAEVATAVRKMNINRPFITRVCPEGWER